MLQTTPLHKWHGANGARFIEFANWSMPIQYGSGSIEEHRLVRRSAGLFDVSHMGQIMVRGNAAGEFLDRLITSDVSSLEDNQSIYGLLCRQDGGVIDDVFVYKLSGEWLVVVNAANAARDLAWFQTNLPAGGVELTDASPRFAMFALQGPRAIDVMDSLCGSEDTGNVGGVPRFSAVRATIAGAECTIGRTGYTGEDGVEIFAPAEHATAIWEAIFAEAGALDIACGPVGLAARDSLRFEPGFALYGHELTEEISPIQARLKWACNLEKDFIGAEALRLQAEQGVTTRLATVQLVERGVPRQGHTVISGGTEVGYVASGMYAPTIDAYCANVFVASALARIGTELEIEIRGNRKRALVVKRPLYKPAYR
ncbi:MAG: glycine cleavage system aminomethyltransferase GcvT [Spirochaetales bacterium]|nr:glycine cleavage system aminomethyltransferase GcvT [Spirochaetales bacterium]